VLPTWATHSALVPLNCTLCASERVLAQLETFVLFRIEIYMRVCVRVSVGTCGTSLLSHVSDQTMMAGSRLLLVAGVCSSGQTSDGAGGETTEMFSACSGDLGRGKATFSEFQLEHNPSIKSKTFNIRQCLSSISTYWSKYCCVKTGFGCGHRRLLSILVPLDGTIQRLDLCTMPSSAQVLPSSYRTHLRKFLSSRLLGTPFLLISSYWARVGVQRLFTANFASFGQPRDAVRLIRGEVRASHTTPFKKSCGPFTAACEGECKQSCRAMGSAHLH
jgi:hypothetical protein